MMSTTTCLNCDNKTNGKRPNIKYCSVKCRTVSGNQRSYQKHREKYIKRVQEWRRKNPEKYKKQRHSKAYWEKNKERQRERRLKALSFYSGGTPQCSCCGEKIVKFLTFDHIVPVSKTKEKRKSSWSVLSEVIKDKGLRKFQVLCYNCNMGKRADEICPHKRLEI